MSIHPLVSSPNSLNGTGYGTLKGRFLHAPRILKVRSAACMHDPALHGCAARASLYVRRSCVKRATLECILCRDLDTFSKHEEIDVHVGCHEHSSVQFPAVDGTVSSHTSHAASTGHAPDVKGGGVKLEVDAHIGRSRRVGFALAEQEYAWALAWGEASQWPSLCARLSLHPQYPHTAVQCLSRPSCFTRDHHVAQILTACRSLHGHRRCLGTVCALAEHFAGMLCGLDVMTVIHISV